MHFLMFLTHLADHRFIKVFFHKVLHTWNRLPFLIRSIPNEPQFKHKVTDFLWSELLNSVGASIPIF